MLARINQLPEGDTSCVEICRSSLFVISTIIVTDIHVHSLVELKVIKKCTVPLLRLGISIFALVIRNVNHIFSAPCYTIICGLSRSTIFLHIFFYKRHDFPQNSR